jgi:hypothetical protein
MKLSSDEEWLQDEIRKDFLKDISDNIPEDIAMCRRLAKKFPVLANQAKQCEELCNQLMMETKNALFKMNNQQE